MSKKPNLLDKFHSRIIAYFPVLAQISGSVNAGILLSQLVYWDEKMKGAEFYKTDRELQQELSMGRHEIQYAKKRLKDAGFISCLRKKHPAKTHYKINKDRLIGELNRPSELPRKRSTGSKPRNGKLDYLKMANKLAGKRSTIYKEVKRLPKNFQKKGNREMNSDEKNWGKCLEEIESQILPYNFENFIAPLSFGGTSNGYIAVICPDIQIKSVIKENFKELLDAEASKTFGRDLQVKLTTVVNR